MINLIGLNGHYKAKQQMLNDLSIQYSEDMAFSRLPKDLLKEAREISISQIDNSLRTHDSLSIAEALAGMLYVVAGTNSYLGTSLFGGNFEACKIKGTFFLTRMASKEQYVGLTAEEIAGIVAGGMLDIVFTPKLAAITETSGMGADRGWLGKRVKTINASTLAAIVMASMGYTSMKHGSYGNTTKVGSTDVPEQFGANIHTSNPDEIQQILSGCNFWFNDAHAVKTLHYLSHLLMTETINHIVGPMTPPVSSETKLFKVMGVNHYVHPETVAQAYVILHQLGIVNLGGAVILSGIRSCPPKRVNISDLTWYRETAFLDEMSPQLTLVSTASPQGMVQTFTVHTERMFGLDLKEEDIKVPNEIESLMRANEQALKGTMPYAQYLALNTVPALAANNINANPDQAWASFYEEALSAICSGSAFDTLRNYVRLTGGKFHSWK